MNQSNPQPPQNYAIDRWGDGYFRISSEGHVEVSPDPRNGQSVDLHRLALDLRRQGLNWPVLVRFTDILHHRVHRLQDAFRLAFDELGYDSGCYRAVYPIKVNQQRSVVEQILVAGGAGVGLEAGSKPELMVVLDQAPAGSAVVCNGYKDREYIRLALIGQRLGLRVYLVVEKPSELDLILGEARAMALAPRLGVRVRLASSAAGKWQNSGGEKAKFGLTASQLLAMVERLRGEGCLDWLQLLHSHIGSQIPNLRDIRRGMTEVGRYLVELRRLGAPISVVDVGGGLGIDYEGTGTRHYCSMNYGPEGYAREVVKTLGQVCRQAGLELPEIFSESGRALTAHHAVLIVNVIENDPAPGGEDPGPVDEHAPEVLKALAAELAELDRRSPTERYQEARLGLEEAQDLFQQGAISLQQRAQAEALFYRVCQQLRGRLNPASRRDRELLDRLNEKLADKLFCNFSLFQSLPDVWAIDQIFPVVPLQRLNEPPSRSAVVQDLTCDSDGCIASYVDQDGIDSSLPVHPLRPDEPYLLGIFLVGAYQEILGDMHNLFGDTDAVNLRLDAATGYLLDEPERGDGVDELLRYVHYDTDRMLQGYREKLAAAGIPAPEQERLFAELEAGLHGYTYLEE